MQSFAQQNKIDSLKNLILTDKEDSNKVIHLYKLSDNYRNFGTLDTSLIFGKEALQLAKKLNYKRGIANCCNNLGNVLYKQGNYSEALKNHFLSLKISEELGDKKGTARSFGNLGVIYTNQENYSEAIKFYEASLKIKKEINDKKGIAATNNNLGALYFNKGDYEAAKKTFSEALATWTEFGDLEGISYCYNNLAGVDNALGNYDEALKNVFASLKIKEEEEDKLGMAFSYNTLGNTYILLKKFSLARDYLDRGLKISLEMGANFETDECYLSLSELDSASGRFKLAYEHYKLYVVYRDSLLNEEHTKETVQAQMQYEFAKRQTADSITNAEKAKQEELKHGQEIQQQKIYTYGGATGFILMLVVAVISFRAFKQKQKANYIIEEQKAIVDEKQKQILDSIHYAKRIQESLLPTEKYIDRNLKRLLKK